MKFLPQLLIILLFSFLGEICHALIPLQIPASIYGMVLMFLALALKLIPVRAVKDTGSFLAGLLPLLFVAPIVGLLDHWAAIRDALLPILLIVFGTTLLVFAVAGWVTQLLIRGRKGGKEND